MTLQNTKKWMIALMLIAAAALIMQCSNTGSTVEAKKPVFLKATPENLKAIPIDQLYKTFVDVEKNEIIDFPEFINRMKGVQVLLFGESHNNEPQHALQLEVLKAFNEDKGHKTVLAMEFLYRPIQKELDAYTAGKMTEAELVPLILQGLNKDWYDKYYRRFILYAGENKLPLLGLNVYNPLKAKYSQVGWDGLTDEEKQYVAKDIDLTNKAHKEYIHKQSEAMIQMGVFTEEQFDRMYWGQCVWDETMGETIANYFKAYFHYADAPRIPVRIMAIEGRAHIEYKFNTPSRAAKRYQMNYKTLIPVETNAQGKVDYGQLLSSGIADFITFSPESPEADMSKFPKKMFQKIVPR
ncbi:MAG: ChaN family lipoprotein [Planctomycetes bacterium]|nr:ChaN family lipoprotein [Planctomycetota bacterium]